MFYVLATVVTIIVLCVLLEKRSEKHTRLENEKRYKRYFALYGSGKIYNDTDELWRCLRWLAFHDKRLLFHLVWAGISPNQQQVFERRAEKMLSCRDTDDVSRDSWQTSAYPAGDGDSGDDGG